MPFLTKKYRTKIKKLFRELMPVLIHEMRSPIKYNHHLVEFLGSYKTPIGYGSS